MHDEASPVLDALQVAAIMATENCSMAECCDAAKVIRDLYDENLRLKELLESQNHAHNKFALEAGKLHGVILRDLDKLRIATQNLVSYVVTCRATNTSEWLTGLVARLNAACEALDDPARFQPAPGGLSYERAEVCP